MVRAVVQTHTVSRHGGGKPQVQHELVPGSQLLAQTDVQEVTRLVIRHFLHEARVGLVFEQEHGGLSHVLQVETVGMERDDVSRVDAFDPDLDGAVEGEVGGVVGVDFWLQPQVVVAGHDGGREAVVEGVRRSRDCGVATFNDSHMIHPVYTAKTPYPLN